MFYTISMDREHTTQTARCAGHNATRITKETIMSGTGTDQFIVLVDTDTIKDRCVAAVAWFDWSRTKQPGRAVKFGAVVRGFETFRCGGGVLEVITQYSGELKDRESIVKKAQELADLYNIERKWSNNGIGRKYPKNSPSSR